MLAPTVDLSQIANIGEPEQGVAASGQGGSFMKRIIVGALVTAAFATPVCAQDEAEVHEVAEDAAAATQAAEPSNTLNLICRGAGSATRENSGGLFSSNGGNGIFGSFGKRDVGFEDQVNLEIAGEEGRLRMPRSMLPAIRGGEDGWFGLRNIQVKDEEITATVTVSIINKPKVRLDRYTGAISISGKSGDYTGQCEKFDPAKIEKAF